MPKRASAERCVRVLGTTMAMNPSREPHIVQVRGYFRIDVYERPVQLTLGALGLEAQRELLVIYEPASPRGGATVGSGQPVWCAQDHRDVSGHLEAARGVMDVRAG